MGTGISEEWWGTELNCKPGFIELGDITYFGGGDFLFFYFCKNTMEIGDIFSEKNKINHVWQSSK